MRKALEYLFDNYENLFAINDIDAWLRYSEFNIIYNKLQLAELQGLNSAPIPVKPNIYPIVIKPIINLYGMSRGFQKVNNYNEYKKIIDNNNLSGYFWETYLEGKQINVDIIIKNGKIIKYFGVESEPDINGTFKYHRFIKNYILSPDIINLLEQVLDEYTGFLNIEIIDGFIIEAHLRLNGDFFIFTNNHIDSLIKFIKTKEYIDIPINDVTFFPIFVKDINKNYDYIGDFLKKNNNFLVDYQKDDINQSAQGDIYKRCYYFITCDFIKGTKLQKYIYDNLI